MQTETVKRQAKQLAFQEEMQIETVKRQAKQEEMQAETLMPDEYLTYEITLPILPRNFADIGKSIKLQKKKKPDDVQDNIVYLPLEDIEPGTFRWVSHYDYHNGFSIYGKPSQPSKYGYKYSKNNMLLYTCYPGGDDKILWSFARAVRNGDLVMLLNMNKCELQDVIDKKNVLQQHLLALCSFAKETGCVSIGIPSLFVDIIHGF